MALFCSALDQVNPVTKTECDFSLNIISSPGFKFRLQVLLSEVASHGYEHCFSQDFSGCLPVSAIPLSLSTVFSIVEIDTEGPEVHEDPKVSGVTIYKMKY